MKIIYYENLAEKFLDALRELSGEFVFKEYDDQVSVSNDAVLFLLGEGRPNLIRLIQKVSKKDPDIGVIVISLNPSFASQLKVAIQFSPFINQHVKVVDSLSIDELKELTAREAALVTTRKKFRKTNERTISKASISLNTQVKSKFFDQFLDQAPVGVVLLNKQHIVLDINDYVGRLFGEGLKIISSYFPDNFRDQKENVEDLLQEGLSREEPTTVTVQHADSKDKYVDLYVSEVVSGNSSFRMVIMLDVTREVMAERKVQDYLGKLESHNKELEQFANILAHDLKSPLSTIQLSGQMAARGPVEQKNHLLKAIHRSANNLHQMIEGLEEIIDVRKNGKGQASQVQFQQMLNDVLSAYQIQIENQNIRMTADFKDAPTIIYHESFLTSIFYNLLSNSIKYRKEKEPLKIQISTERSDRYILLKFSDNGIGMDLNKHKANLFQPFRRFTAQAQGRGIGLSIIKSMIEKNNGKIAVESTVGVGTTFYCYLCPYE